MINSITAEKLIQILQQFPNEMEVFVFNELTSTKEAIATIEKNTITQEGKEKAIILIKDY